MKTILAFLMVTSAFATIPQGTYLLDRIECTTGETLKLGGAFMRYNVTLKIAEENAEMTAIAKSAKWAPYLLNCTQVNSGEFKYIGPGQYQGGLEMTKVKCNLGVWEGILKKQHFGVESNGSIFDYEYSDGKLVLSVKDTFTNYKTCREAGGSPIYHYKKQ
ncbi:hypothetical protein M902_0600 [Bacteriovorax sp. BAL6_X]|uniref:hypothetical protein n=1 Tax=Bacteriovorax sp. BAL6_X TaxID=1201290 RepID=UPI0003856575|nr:hypothetical protein [Bacteriovorax sp. BAL6_X]EPZ50056.1 hypothetical protein M902_0600 [Bacteriovorax sp. BAL6_X]